MDPIGALIAGVFAAIGAFLGSIGRPFAEDRTARWAEDRARRRDALAARVARVEELRDLLLTAPEGTGSFSRLSVDAKRTLGTYAHAVGDARLTELCEVYADAPLRTDEADDALYDARRRCGELLHELESGGHA